MDGHALLRAEAHERATVSELEAREVSVLGAREASVLAERAARGSRRNASAESHGGYQNGEQSHAGHRSAETRDGGLNAEAPADYSAEKSRDVLVGCRAVRVLRSANEPWGQCGFDLVDGHDWGSASALLEAAVEVVVDRSTAVVPDARN